MTLRSVITLAILIAIASGAAFVVGVGETADRVALVLLCWAAMSVPVSLFFGRVLDGARIAERDNDHY